MNQEEEVIDIDADTKPSVVPVRHPLRNTLMIVVALAVMGTALYFAYMKFVSPGKNGLSAEEKMRILEELENQSGDRLSQKEKENVLQTLESQSSNTMSADEKRRILQELQNK